MVTQPLLPRKGNKLRAIATVQSWPADPALFEVQLGELSPAVPLGGSRMIERQPSAVAFHAAHPLIFSLGLLDFIRTARSVESAALQRVIDIDPVVSHENLLLLPVELSRYWLICFA
jgi:hypothetical protein